MYSFLLPSPGTVDKNPISHTVHNSVQKTEKEKSVIARRSKEIILKAGSRLKASKR